jgi:hypothetical protein
MSSEYPKFYTDCEHIITETPNGPDANELSNSTQEIIKGRCPNCSNTPIIPIQSEIEPLPTGHLASHVKTMGDKLQTDNLKASALEEMKATMSGEHGSAGGAPMDDHGTNMEEEIAGKENIDSRHLSAEKLKTVALASTSNVTAATKR